MPALEELTAETKVQIAKAIFIFEALGDLNIVENKFEIDADTVQQIKKQTEQALNAAFADKEEKPLIVDPDSIFAYITGKPKSEESSQNDSPIPARQKRPNLTVQQKEQLKIVLRDIKAYNKENPNAQVKASEGILKAGLDHYKMPAPVILTKLNETKDKSLLDEIKSINEKTDQSYKKQDKKYPTGNPAGNLVDAFAVYLESESSRPNDQVESESEKLVTAGESKSKK